MGKFKKKLQKWIHPTFKDHFNMKKNHTPKDDFNMKKILLPKTTQNAPKYKAKTL